MLFQVISVSIWNNLHTINLLGVWFSENLLGILPPPSFNIKGFQTMQMTLPWNRSEMWLTPYTHSTVSFYIFNLISKIWDINNAFLFSSYGCLSPFFLFVSLHYFLVCYRLQCCIDTAICKSFWALLLYGHLCVRVMGLGETDGALKSRFKIPVKNSVSAQSRSLYHKLGTTKMIVHP